MHLMPQTLQEPVGTFPTLATSLENSETASDDREFFIRKAFETNPEEGCSLLFRQYYTPLYSHALRFVYSKELAKDIVSEIFHDFWRNRVYENITVSYRAYLFRTVRNRACDHFRREIRQNKASESRTAPEPLVAEADQQILYDELRHKIEQIIETMTPQCKKVFLMSRFEGKKHKEIAQSLSISEKTIETHIHRALVALRQGLNRNGFLTAVGLWLSILVG
ncbi:MAG: RNA polymerase sigma-70 factor [Cytophagales bacterium]|jgi:RNA polymerase sigma-70 factor (ECF subfamily)|nr:RNA polymerase sigma-70 factor [Cytophagales bacterium]